MRTMITITIPVEPGNRAIKDGAIEKTIGEFVQTHRPEAAYFFTKSGIRTGVFVIDMKDVTQIPVIAEPFFINFNAAVDFAPVMNAEDLKKGLEAFAKPQMAAR